MDILFNILPKNIINHIYYKYAPSQLKYIIEGDYYTLNILSNILPTDIIKYIYYKYAPPQLKYVILIETDYYYLTEEEFKILIILLINHIYRNTDIYSVKDLETKKIYKNKDVADNINDRRLYYSNIRANSKYFYRRNEKLQTIVPKGKIKYHFIVNSSEDTSDITTLMENRYDTFIYFGEKKDEGFPEIIENEKRALCNFLFPIIKHIELKGIQLVKFYINGSSISFFNERGVNKDIRGADNIPIKLKFHKMRTLTNHFSLHNLCTILYDLKSHKFDKWYELYSGCEIAIEENKIAAKLYFDHGS